MIVSQKYHQYGYVAGVYIGSVGTRVGSLTIKTKFVGDGFGAAPKGDYNLKLFRLKCKEVA